MVYENRRQTEGFRRQTEQLERLYRDRAEKNKPKLTQLNPGLVNKAGEVYNWVTRYYGSRKLKSGKVIVIDHHLGRGDLFSYPLAFEGAITRPEGDRLHPIDKVIKTHFGIDLATNKENWPVLAIAPGELSVAKYEVDAKGPEQEYGNFIMIRHNDPAYLIMVNSRDVLEQLEKDGLIYDDVKNETLQKMNNNSDAQFYLRFRSLYGHLDRFSDDIQNWSMDYKNGVYRSMRIERGQTIGLSGNTGKSTEEHLHFEIISDMIITGFDKSCLDKKMIVGKGLPINPGKLMLLRVPDEIREEQIYREIKKYSEVDMEKFKTIVKKFDFDMWDAANYVDSLTSQERVIIIKYGKDLKICCKQQ